MIWDANAIFTCTQKPTKVSLMYQKLKKVGKTFKKIKTDMLSSTDKQSGESTALDSSVHSTHVSSQPRGFLVASCRKTALQTLTVMRRNKWKNKWLSVNTLDVEVVSAAHLDELWRQIDAQHVQYAGRVKLRRRNQQQIVLPHTSTNHHLRHKFWLHTDSRNSVPAAGSLYRKTAKALEF